MKYSEAIRLGGMMRPKAQGTIYDPETGGVCVQGAALAACGKLQLVEQKHDMSLVDLFPMFFGSDAPIVKSCDVPTYSYSWSVNGILEISVWLNDYTNWTRERIADWVEKMEIKYNIYNDQPIKTEVTNEDTTNALTPIN